MTCRSFAPAINAKWEAQSGEPWTVPLGLAAGQISSIGTQPANAQIGA